MGKTSKATPEAKPDPEPIATEPVVPEETAPQPDAEVLHEEVLVEVEDSNVAGSVPDSAFESAHLDAFLDNESVCNMRGLDNIIAELHIEVREDEQEYESKFFDWCALAADMLHQFEAPDENILSWSDLCGATAKLDLAIEEEFGDFWIESLDSEVIEREYFRQRPNMNASIICLKLSAALKYKKMDQLNIAAACLVHDIGNAAFSDANESAVDEKSRVERSVNIMKKAGAPADMLRAMSECAERTDGSGVPLGLHGNQISLKGQLLGMAVEFERLFRAQQENFKEQGAAFEPVMQMLKEHRAHFQPQVLKSLLLTSGFYQVGAIVELNSGALARVITQNPGSPLRPLVEVVLDRAGNHPPRRQILDLRDNLTLSIVRTVAKGK